MNSCHPYQILNFRQMKLNKQCKSSKMNLKSPNFSSAGPWSQRATALTLALCLRLLFQNRSTDLYIMCGMVVAEMYMS